VELGRIAAINALSLTRSDAPEDIRYVDISSVSPGRVEGVQDLAFSDAPSRARRIVRHGDVIWSTVRPNRKSYALILDPPQNMIVSTGFAVLSPTNVPFSYLYQAITTDAFADYLTNHTTGAAYPAVNADVFANAELCVPTRDLLDCFDEVVGALLCQKAILLRQIPVLEAMRDLLLPRLVSGEIDVTDLGSDLEHGRQNGRARNAGLH
jgi:type I restriction enzyme S subunit